MGYDAALKRVRALVLAREAIDGILADAVRELDEAAVAEGRRIDATIPASAPAPPTHRSGMHARVKR